MALKLNDKYLSGFIGENEFANIQPMVNAAHDWLENKTGPGNAFLGWRTASCNYDREEYARIKAAAKKIQDSCDVFIVAGIGGSYLGSRAVLELLRSPRYNNIKKSTPDIFFTGRSLSAAGIQELLNICEGKDVCINVISKSGTTTETAVAFRILREMLEKKYGKDDAAKHIYVTTDKEKGTLRSFSDKEGYETFVVPDDMGGRYSMLSAVGLLPLAVSGVDIDDLMAGAEAARVAYTSPDLSKNDAYKYAAIRNILLRKGKNIEILVAYESYLQIFSEWWKQLFGESEGKDGKGIYPASATFTTDLHSLGQYIQEGQRIMFETIITIQKPDCALVIPHDENNIDGLNFLSGKTISEVNATAMKGTLLAHNDGGVPNIILELRDRSAFSAGYMIYFFWLACAMSGYLLGVNPFDQPGVEAYKKNMFALLGKPGFEERRAELEARLK